MLENNRKVSKALLYAFAGCNMTSTFRKIKVMTVKLHRKYKVIRKSQAWGPINQEIGTEEGEE